jgi:hypothetical protein
LQRKYNILRRALPSPALPLTLRISVSLSLCLCLCRSIHVKREKTERQKLKDTTKLKLSLSSVPNPSTDEDDIPPPSHTHHYSVATSTTAATALTEKEASATDNSPNTSIHSGSEISQLSKSSLPVTPRGNPNESHVLAGDREVLQWGHLKKKKKFAATRGQYSNLFFVLKTDGYLYYYHV